MARVAALLLSAAAVLIAAGSPIERSRAQESDSAGWVQGIPWVGSPPVHETTASLMARKPDAAELAAREPRPAKPAYRRASFGVAAAGTGPAATAGVPVPSSGLASPVPRIGQTLAMSFTAATAVDAPGVFPPDTMGAVGPTQFLLGINGLIRVLDRATGAIGALDLDMDVFFYSVRGGKYTSDPRVRYDRLAQRWFVTIITVEIPNKVLIAVSDGPTILGSTDWSFYSFKQSDPTPAGESDCLADYPTLGIDANALYIGANQFCGPNFSSLGFGGSTVFVVRKSSLLAALPLVVTAFRNVSNGAIGPGPYTPQGVDNPDPAATEGYFVGTDVWSPGLLVIREIGSPGGAPTISLNRSLSVPSTAQPIGVPHKGNSGGDKGLLDSIDDRLFNAVVRNGRLWAAQNISVDTTGEALSSGSAQRVAVRWYEIKDFGADTPTLIQSGTIFDSAFISPLFYWIPSIAVSGQGHMLVGMSSAGANAYANAAFAGRLAGDPIGTFRGPFNYTASSSSYNPPGDDGSSLGVRRWGDYSFTSVDPCDDMTMWTVQEYTAATNVWGVKVAKFLAPPPATPTSVLPSTVPSGTSSITITVSASPVDGSSFFDPGAVFACRLSASLGGGVTVNSVRYLSPTRMLLNVSTVGASPGSKSLTIVNPDGQSTTAIGALSVMTASAYPAPSLSVISPVTTTAGAPAITISLVGSGFIPGATVALFAGNQLDSTVVSSTLMTAVVPASAVGATGVVTVAAFTMAPGGGLTASLPFTVHNSTHLLHIPEVFVSAHHGVHGAPVLPIGTMLLSLRYFEGRYAY